MQSADKAAPLHHQGQVTPHGVQHLNPDGLDLLRLAVDADWDIPGSRLLGTCGCNPLTKRLPYIARDR
jgi:hypothetical protein